MRTPENWTQLPAQERQALKFQMERDDKKSAPVAVPEVVVPGHEVQAGALPKQPREVRALLESQGRQVVTKHSRTAVKGLPIKSKKSKRYGQNHPDKLTDHYSLATVDKQCPVVLAYWDNGDNMWFCKVGISWEDRREVRLVTELKKLLEEIDVQ
jgi:hypothetical protein